MKTKFGADLILLLAAVIWGFAFVAQRVGMDYVGPFTYNGVRFTLGILVLLPFLILSIRRGEPMILTSEPLLRKKIIAGSCLTGLFLFGGVAFQQLGLMETTAGKAGFITGLYVIFVPLAGLFSGHRAHFTMWIGAILALAGLYLLSITGSLKFASGDMLVFYCAVIFTFHVLLIAWISPYMNSFLLATVQFSICALLNLVMAFMTEDVNPASIAAAWVPIIYGGVLSVGIAYTLQVIAQKTAHPTHASIILSLEAVFAVIGGWLLLDEHLTRRMILGCLLMLAGMIVVQVRRKDPDSISRPLP